MLNRANLPPQSSSLPKSKSTGNGSIQSASKDQPRSTPAPESLAGFPRNVREARDFEQVQAGIDQRTIAGFPETRTIASGDQQVRFGGSVTLRQPLIHQSFISGYERPTPTPRRQAPLVVPAPPISEFSRAMMAAGDYLNREANSASTVRMPEFENLARPLTSRSKPVSLESSVSPTSSASQALPSRRRHQHVAPAPEHRPVAASA